MDIQLKVYADQMLDEFSKGIEKKIKWIQPILLMGPGLLIVSMYLILLLPTLIDDWRKLNENETKKKGFTLIGIARVFIIN